MSPCDASLFGHSTKARLDRCRGLVLAVVIGLTATGCGTRVVQRDGGTAALRARADSEAGVANPEMGGGGSGAAGRGPVAALPDGNIGPDGAASAALGGSAAAAVTRAPGTGITRPLTGAATTPSGAASGGGTAGRSTPGAAAGSPAAIPAPGPGAGASPTPAGPGSPSAPGPATKSLVKIGSVGTLSGPVGGVLHGAVEALQVWQRMINDRGGINGHPVRILFVDDGGESPRHLAAMRDLVEREKVIAFVQDSAPLGNGRSSQAYIEEKHIPVIGSETGSQWFYESPMYFPQASSGYLAFYAGVVSHGRAVAMGKKKLATLACAEINACQDADQIYARFAPSQGFDHVYRGRVSVTQPDYTAECLAARNAGADFLVFADDTASINRAMASCVRQGYRPTVGLLMSMITDSQRNDPNLVGAIGTSNIFPWFESNTPATAEFHAAMKKYLPNGVLGIAHATAWTSAKLLEKALSAAPEPPASDAILRALWTMKDETLGGLTRVSFHEGDPAAKLVCWWDIQIKDSQWVTSDNFTQRCTNPPSGL